MAPIPDEYKDWPVVMTINQTAKLLGVDWRTVAKTKFIMENCTLTIGEKPKIIRDKLLRELGIIQY